MSAKSLELPGTAWNESDRLKAIEEYEILDSPKEEEFQDIVKLAADMCSAPIAMVSIVAKDRQWFKAEVGLEVRETPLVESICKFTILQHGLLVIPDIAQDPRSSIILWSSAKIPFDFMRGPLLKLLKVCRLAPCVSSITSPGT